MAAPLVDHPQGASPPSQRAFKAALVLVVLVRVFNAVTYSPRAQYDSNVHLGYLESLAQLAIPASYNAPWAYALTLLVAAPIAVPLKLLGVPPVVVQHASLGFAQILFFLVLLLGCYRLGRRLWSPELGLRFAVLVGAFPIVQRILCMTRPEGLLMVATPWLIVLSLTVAPRLGRTLKELVRVRAFIGLIAIQALIIAQKVGGVVICATAPAFLLSSGVKPREAAHLLTRSWPLVAMFASVLIGAQAMASGHTPFQHDVEGKTGVLCRAGFRPAPLGFLTSFRPWAAWQEPFRDARRESMPEILFIDAYGDYWRYGADTQWLSRPQENRLARARYGMVVGACFAALWLLCTAGLTLLAKTPAQRAQRRHVLASLLPLLGSAAFLTAATLKFYCPDDGDIAKWEYVAWVFVFLPIPLLAVASAVSGRVARFFDALLLCLALASLPQCWMTPFF